MEVLKFVYEHWFLTLVFLVVPLSAAALAFGFAVEAIGTAVERARDGGAE